MSQSDRDLVSKEVTKRSTIGPRLAASDVADPPKKEMLSPRIRLAGPAVFILAFCALPANAELMLSSPVDLTHVGLDLAGEQRLSKILSQTKLKSMPPKFSKIAKIQGPLISSNRASTVTLVENISRVCFWSIFSFYSHPLPNPIGLKFLKSNHSDRYENWRPALALGPNFRPLKPTIIDQLNRDDPSEFQVRFSVARPIAKMDWENGFPELSLSITPAAILASNREPLVLTNDSDRQTLRMRSLLDFSSDGVLLGLSTLALSPIQKSQEWIPQRIPGIRNPAYQIFLQNGKDITKFTRYLASSLNFSIERKSLHQETSGTYFIDDGKIIAAVFGGRPTNDEVKAIGKTSGATFAFTGKPRDFIALPLSVRDRIQFGSKILSNLEKVWIISTGRLIPFTLEDRSAQPALFASLIRSSDGILLKPLSVISVYN